MCLGYKRSESVDRIRLVLGTRVLDLRADVVRSSYAIDTSKNGGHGIPQGHIVGDVTGVIFLCAISATCAFERHAQSATHCCWGAFYKEVFR